MKISFMKEDAKVNSPREVVDALIPGYLNEKRECLGLVMLDVKKKVVANEIISIGTLSEAIVHPRDVFKAAVLASASSIIIVHNHPSGDVEESMEDVALANKMSEAGRLMGIKLIDFIIVGDKGFKSFNEAGISSVGE